jgi:hypothetical protein
MLKALSLYPVHFPRVPHLVHDYGFILVRNAFYRPALLSLESVYPFIPAPHERVVVVGNIARASGGAGHVDRFRLAVEEVQSLVGVSDENASRGLLGVAEGSHCLGYTSEAIAFASHAIDVAVRRGDKEVERLARLVIDRVKRAEGAPADRGEPPGFAAIAREFSDRLRRWNSRPRGQAANMLKRQLPKGSPTETAASTGWKRPAT